MKRILVFSPYALWKIHTIYEETIAKACRMRGANVEYLLCDGLPECDQHWDSKTSGPRPLDLCQRCQSSAKDSLERLGFSHHWLREFVTEGDRASASDWAQSVPVSELMQSRYNNLPLGGWVLSSVISYFRQYPPDLSNSHVVSVYRGFLLSAAVTAIGLQSYLRNNPIDAALLFNGRQSIPRVALEIFRQHNIRVLIHERPEYQRGNINARPNAHCMNLEPFHALWKMWSDVPLNGEELNRVLQWLIQRRYGANLAWLPFNASFSRDSSSRKKLNLSAHKRLWVLFTSSTDETAGDPLWQGPYESQAAWVHEVVRWVESRDDVELVIKVHPNLGGNQYIGKAVEELRIYQEMEATLPANVRLVLPDAQLNAYALADEADVGLTFGSTIGLEMAMLGKPVLLASRALYEYASKILVVRNKELLPEMLEKCLRASRDVEIQREAFRLGYYYIFKFELPFPAIEVSSIFEAKLNYSDGDCAAGKDVTLDRLCNFLTDGSPLFDTPTTSDRSGTAVEEDAFFRKLEQSPGYLRDFRYERWLRFKAFGRSTTSVLRRLPFGIGDALLNLGRESWHGFLKGMENGKASPSKRQTNSKQQASVVGQ